MRRALEQHGVLGEDDPHAVPIGFMKTDRLLDGSLDREAILRAEGLWGDRPVVLYAPTGAPYNSLETWGMVFLERLRVLDVVDILVKPHDHPKNVVDWRAGLSVLEGEHLRIVRSTDVVESMFVSDLLVSDASSVSNEFALLDRPMVFLDVPALIAASAGKDSALDLETWGRRAGVVARIPTRRCARSSTGSSIPSAAGTCADRRPLLQPRNGHRGRGGLAEGGRAAGMTAFAQRLPTVVRRLRPVARAHRRWLLFGSLGTLLVVVCRLALPWPLKGVVDLAVKDDTPALLDLESTADGRVYWLAGAFVAIAVARGFAELAQRLSFARFAIGLVHDARAEALGRLQREGAAGRDPGDLIARIVGDSARLKSGLKGVLIRFTQNGTFFVGVCVMLLIIDPLLGVVFVAGGTVILGVAAFGASRVARISRRLRKREGRIAAHMHAVMSGGEGDDELDAVERRVGHAEAKTTRLEGLVMWAVHALLALPRARS